MPSTFRCGPIAGRTASPARDDPTEPARPRCGCPGRPAAAPCGRRCPTSAVTGRSPIVSIHVRRVSRATPPGLAKPVAVLACSRVSPMPTEQLRPVSASTRCLHLPGQLLGVAVTAPTKASSHPHTSTTTGNDRSVAMTRADACRRPAGRTGRNTASGHFRAAGRAACPSCTPNARASYGRRGHHLARPGRDRRRPRPRPGGRRARGAAGPRRRPGTGRGRRGGPSPARSCHLPAGHRLGTRAAEPFDVPGELVGRLAGVSSLVSISTSYRACPWTVHTCARVIPGGRSPLRCSRASATSSEHLMPTQTTAMPSSVACQSRQAVSSTTTSSTRTFRPAGPPRRRPRSRRAAPATDWADVKDGSVGGRPEPQAVGRVRSRSAWEVRGPATRRGAC